MQAYFAIPKPLGARAPAYLTEFRATCRQQHGMFGSHLGLAMAVTAAPALFSAVVSVCLRVRSSRSRYWEGPG